MGIIRYGILGCGKHAMQSHAIPGKDIAGLELYAICDLSEEQLGRFEAVYGSSLRKYKDRAQFLASGIEAVLIATPDECHFSGLCAAVDAGLHTFVEKPLCVNPEELKSLSSVLCRANEKGLIVSTCHPRRYDPPFMWLSDNLAGLKERLGNPIEFRFDFSYHRPTSDWKHGRGLLLDHANHEIDLVHHLFGHLGFDAWRQADGFDHYQMAGRRDDGLSFCFGGSRRLDTQKYIERVHMRFDKGELCLSAHDGVARIVNHETGLSEEIYVGATDYVLRGRRTMANFVDAILGIDLCYVSASDLYANTATCVMLTENERWRYEANG